MRSLCLSSPAELLGASAAASQAVCGALRARGPRGVLCCFCFGSERTRHRITDSPRCRGECEGGESPGWRPLKSRGTERIAPARDSSLGSRSVPAAVHRDRASPARPGFLTRWAGRERCTCHVGFSDPGPQAREMSSVVRWSTDNLSLSDPRFGLGGQIP